MPVVMGVEVAAEEVFVGAVVPVGTTPVDVAPVVLVGSGVPVSTGSVAVGRTGVLVAEGGVVDVAEGGTGVLLGGTLVPVRTGVEVAVAPPPGPVIRMSVPLL